MSDRFSLGAHSSEEQDAMREKRRTMLRGAIDLGMTSGPGIPAEQAFANARACIADIVPGDAGYDAPG